jgi:hypothetical protein
VSFDLGFWHEDHPITAGQAVQIYQQLCNGNVNVVKAHPTIAAFVQEISQHYPPIEAYTLEHIADCPWSTQWYVTAGAVIFSMTWSEGPNLATRLIQIGHQHDLVCFNPQREEIYLPARLLQTPSSYIL